MTAKPELAILDGDPVRPVGPPGWPPNDPEINAALQLAIANQTWGQYFGPHTKHLTTKLQTAHNCEHVLLASSGTCALELALRGCSVEPGDEVILSAYDFKGNMATVLALQAKPVLVDVRSDNWQLDVTQVEAAISPQTKAMIASHLHGGPVDVGSLKSIAETHSLPLIEDACQMPGAIIKGQVAGCTGDVGILSFGGSKLLSAGRGGALITNRADILQRIKLYAQRTSFAFALSELQAAVLCPQFDRLAERNKHRTRSVEFLTRELATINGLTPFLQTLPDTQPGYYKLGLQFGTAHFAYLSRDRLAEAVRAEGIALDPGFRSLHKTHSARRYRTTGELSEADNADANVLTLHHPILLGNEHDLQEIITAIKKVQQHAEWLVEG